MRIIELVELTKVYNGLLIKWIKGAVWLEDPANKSKITEENEKTYQELTKTMAEIHDTFDQHNITFKETEALECIELPEETKRIHIEKWLEEYSKFKKGEK